MIDDRYPDFPDIVEAWIAEDPALDARIRCDVQLLGLTDAPRILHVTHNMGGGVEQHVRFMTARRERRLASFGAQTLGQAAIGWSGSEGTASFAN